MVKSNKGNGNGGEIVKMCGVEFHVRPPLIKDPYAKIMMEIEGLSPITGPTAPNLDTYQAMLDARVKKGLLTPEVRDKFLAEVRGKQVERMMSDPNGDASGDIITESVSAAVHVFARDKAGVLGLQSYAFRACLRECFSETGFFKSNRGTRERFALGVGVWPLFLQLERNGVPITEADGIDSHPVHVWSGGRKNDSISQFEFVEPPWSMKIMLAFRHDSILKPQDAISVLSMLPTVGLGAQRSMGFGRCRLRVVSDVVEATDQQVLVQYGIGMNE